VAADNDQPGCRDAPCESGQEQCNGADIQRCSADRTRFDTIATCETRGLCNDDNNRAASCDPPVCQRGPLSGTEFRCQGLTLQRCNDQFTGFDTLKDCATPGLCNAGLGLNGCQPPVCAPGQTRCSGDFLQVCNSQRTGFDNLERCAGGTCDSNAGRCSDPCIVGTARCNNQGQLEECRDRLVGRQVTALCPSPQLCDPVARACRQPPAGCTADGVHQCVRQGANTLLQVCADGRSRFNTVDTCTGGEVCDPNNAAPNQNVCDACAQNSQPTCVGNELVTCSADGLTPSRVICPNGCQEVANGPDRCRSCALGSATCDGAGLLVCVSSGATGEFRERRACTTPGTCQSTLAACNANGTGQNCSCAPGVCTAGQRDCRGNQPVKCADDLLSFVNDGASCGTRICFPRPGSTEHPAGTCGCRPGEDVQCVGGILQTCTPTGTFEPDPRFVRGGVLCLPGPNGTGQRALGCNGNTLRDDTCSFGCSVEKGCAECDSSFKPVCDGVSSRTVCNGGEILEGQACVSTASNPCVETLCASGACNPNAPREDGTPCGSGGRCENGVCASCGDGVINGDEQCDTDVALGCPTGQVGSIPCMNCQRVNQCRTPTCEDGIRDPGEACQPGDPAQNCPMGQTGSIPCVACQRVNQCRAPSCEDGIRDPGEACQPTDAAQTCPAGQVGSIPCVNCQRVNQCRTPSCEDGIRDPGEACQPGDAAQNCPAGQTGSIPCVDCQRVNQCTRVPSCADGIPDPGEGCQPGDAALACAAGQTGSIPCVDCQRVNQCSRVPSCADGIPDPGEACQSGDPALSCPDGQTGSIPCVSCQRVNQCTRVPSCADGIPDPGEACQPGDAPQGCPDGQTGSIPCVNCQRVNQCTAVRVPSCADGIPDPGEACQPGDAAQGCPMGQTGSIPCVNCQRVNQCTAVRVPTCEDGIPDPGEACQPGDGPQDCPPGQQGAIICQNCQRVSQCTDVPAPGMGNGGPGMGNGNGGPGMGNGNGNAGNGNGNAGNGNGNAGNGNGNPGNGNGNPGNGNGNGNAGNGDDQGGGNPGRGNQDG
jgi:hypothetical protein